MSTWTDPPDQQTGNGSNIFGAEVEDRIYEQIQQRFGSLLEEGLTEAEAVSKLGDVTSEVLDQKRDDVIANLKARGPQMFLEHSAIQQEFESRLLRRWQEPLTNYKMVSVVAQEAGADFSPDPDAEATHGYLYTALSLIHGRACLTASEVFALLRTGHASGAHARWRTMHELAVVSYVLTHERGGNELAERYLLHEGVQQARDALEYQQHSDALGYEPLDQAVVDRLVTQRDNLIRRFGKSFRNQFGWAAPFFDTNSDPNFSELERGIGMEHRRPHYALASHRVHPGAKGNALNVLRRGPDEMILTGPTNIGLTDPAHSTLISLHQITTNLLIHGRPNLGTEPMRVIILQVLEKLVEEAGDSFLAVEKQIQDEEEHLWSEQAREAQSPLDEM